MDKARARPNREEINTDSLALIIVKLVVVIIVVTSIWELLFSGSDKSNDNETATNQNDSLENTNTTDLQDQKIVKIVPPPQPTCPKSYVLVILSEICMELVRKNQECTPEDFHDMTKHKIIAKNNTTSEPRGTIVGYITAGLLLASLGAAIVELYKAKSQTPQKTKAPLSRKCSLADLTVLKHHRKELVRRESILEVPEESIHTKQLGFRPPPLNRRCSFPVGPNKYNFGTDFRRTSIVDSRRSSILDNSRRQSIVDDGRRLSFVDNRRTSVDCRVLPMIDGRRISISDDSPERRHYSRLVHRH